MADGCLLIIFIQFFLHYAIITYSYTKEGAKINGQIPSKVPSSDMVQHLIMGRAHANMMQNTDGIECVAVCDIDSERTDAAKKDFPRHPYYNTVRELSKNSTPTTGLISSQTFYRHSLHCGPTVASLKAGKHVVVEKPMCVTIAEATEMITTAKENDVMLSVHHNRRWDADFWTLRELVQSGIIGKVFSVEMWGGGYGRPNPDWWRSVKAISGGQFYDWGAHYPRLASQCS